VRASAENELDVPSESNIPFSQIKPIAVSSERKRRRESGGREYRNHKTWNLRQPIEETLQKAVQQKKSEWI